MQRFFRPHNWKNKKHQVYKNASFYPRHLYPWNREARVLWKSSMHFTSVCRSVNLWEHQTMNTIHEGSAIYFICIFSYKNSNFAWQKSMKVRIYIKECATLTWSVTKYANRHLPLAKVYWYLTWRNIARVDYIAFDNNSKISNCDPMATCSVNRQNRSCQRNIKLTV